MGSQAVAVKARWACRAALESAHWLLLSSQLLVSCPCKASSRCFYPSGSYHTPCLLHCIQQIIDTYVDPGAATPTKAMLEALLRQVPVGCPRGSET